MEIRTFIAIEINDPLRKEFVGLQNELRKSDADIKWVEPENMHITLKFLGKTEENKIEKIKEVIKKIAQETNSFEINFCGLGTFPHLNFPRVLWVGIEEGKEELTKLANKIELSLIPLGFSKEKKTYSCHLTLGRIRSFKNKDKLKKMVEGKNNFCAQNKLRLTKIILFRSDLTSSGPIYTKLAEFSLS